MKKTAVILLSIATLCFAATESRISRATILAVERSVDQKIAAYSPDPYYALGDARATYLEGYGVLITNELNLINDASMSPSPFKPAVTKEEIAAARARKDKKLVELKDTMRQLMMNASVTLENLPPNEHVAMETILFSYSWENSRGLPHRVFMTAEKQKLLDAKAAHAAPQDLAAIIEEQER
ncbi:MAG TPA: hypothetical protein VG297_20090 [Bryobacteraceae bacterium]|jgi:hypothetical protein|nr:hypothetical protein [Bryobacteraceae bacterium]